MVDMLSPPSSSSSGCSSALSREPFGGWIVWGLPASRHILQPQYPVFRVFVGKSMIFVLTSDSFVIFSVCCWSRSPVCINFAFSLVNNAREMRLKSIMTVCSQSWAVPALLPVPAQLWSGQAVPKDVQSSLDAAPVPALPAQHRAALPGRDQLGSRNTAGIIFTQHIIVLARADLKSI